MEQVYNADLANSWGTRFRAPLASDKYFGGRHSNF